MKTLCIMRHAKSDWGAGISSDFERGLNPRGQRDAPRMGAALMQWLPGQSIHASPARRAQQTLEGLIEGWPSLAEQSHHTVPDLYTFEVEDLVRWLQAQQSPSDHLWLLGHNPGLTDLVNWMCGEVLLDNLPTAGFVQLALAVDHWPDVHRGCAEVQQRLFPRQL